MVCKSVPIDLGNRPAWYKEKVYSVNKVDIVIERLFIILSEVFKYDFTSWTSQTSSMDRGTEQDGCLYPNERLWRGSWCEEDEDGGLFSVHVKSESTEDVIMELVAMQIFHHSINSNSICHP